MSDEEDFDEFPPITVNSSIHESSSFSMPSAEELATQRAREADCERALLRLREEHDVADRECRVAGVSALAHSDSSGSEGEAALAAAVTALQVRPAPAAPLAALQPGLPPPAQRLARAYAAALRGAGEPAARALTLQVASGVSRMLGAAARPGARAWRSEEALGVGAWLCGAAAAAAPRRARALLRPLHALLDDVATDDQARELGALLTRAALSADAALELCDALRSGSERGEALARAVAARALAHLAALPEPQDRSMFDIAAALPAAWRRLPPAEQYLALQLLARLLPPPGWRGGREGEAARALLDALAQAAPGQRAQTTDTLKVLVAATKLQVLFHIKK